MNGSYLSAVKLVKYFNRSLSSLIILSFCLIFWLSSRFCKFNARYLVCQTRNSSVCDFINCGNSLAELSYLMSALSWRFCNVFNKRFSFTNSYGKNDKAKNQYWYFEWLSIDFERVPHSVVVPDSIDFVIHDSDAAEPIKRVAEFPNLKHWPIHWLWMPPPAVIVSYVAACDFLNLNSMPNKHFHFSLTMN